MKRKEDAIGTFGICRCGGKIRVVPAEQIYGKAAAERLKPANRVYPPVPELQCEGRLPQGYQRPLGSVANETLRLKRMRRATFLTVLAQEGYDAYPGYRWLKKLDFVKRTTSGALRWTSAG